MINYILAPLTRFWINFDDSYVMYTGSSQSDPKLSIISIIYQAPKIRKNCST